MTQYDNPNWEPLEKKVVSEFCGEFMWMFRNNGVEYYKHRDTRNYLMINRKGQCFVKVDGKLQPATFEAAWIRATGRTE